MPLFPPQSKAILTTFPHGNLAQSTPISLACGVAKSVHVTVVDGHGEEHILEPAVLMEIEKLRRMGLPAMRARYREVFGEETRCQHREHLFRRIAWRLQALSEGDLTERARERAAELARDADLRLIAPRGFFMVEGAPVRTTHGAGDRPTDCRLPLPGTLLSRKWKGRTILVEVLADGFRFEDRVYSSLSAVAVAITGTRWNGLAFFGLTGKQQAKRMEQPHAAE
jgi:hypothetical protein